MCPNYCAWKESMSMGYNYDSVFVYLREKAAIGWLCLFVRMRKCTPSTHMHVDSNCITKTEGRWVGSLCHARAVQQPALCQTHRAVCIYVCVCICVRSLLMCQTCGNRMHKRPISSQSPTPSPCHIHLFKTCFFEWIHPPSLSLCLLASLEAHRRISTGER